jgi:hypothetical protein
MARKVKRPAARRPKRPSRASSARTKTRPTRTRTRRAPARSEPATPPQPASAPGGAPASGALWIPEAGEAGVRIRMYRVGFGDFFLVSFNGKAAAPLHIIIDCGVFKGTSQTGDIGTIEAAVDNMAEVTGGKVALIIMTHRHADHIAGFARCASTFKLLQVEGVWMPIWESEYSPVAVKFQAELARTALTLQQHLTSLGAKASPEAQTARKYMENATGERGKGSNATALKLLKTGFPGVTPQYYEAGSQPKLPQPLIDAGLTARILGPPPVTDLDLMKLMDLQKGVGQYLAAAQPVSSGQPEPFAPFGIRWEVEPFANRPASDRQWLAPEAVREFVGIDGPNRRAWGDVSLAQANEAREYLVRVIEQSQPAAALTAAKQLNSFLNNQSLVVLFSFAGKQLLFVGDAQAGSWEHWLFNTDTPDKQGTAGVVKDAANILSSVAFYKVGHHGSTNATPKAAVDAMARHAQPFAAMCSTQAGVYGTEDPDDPSKGTEVPRIPLLQHLATESALVRSDQIEVQLDGKTVKAAVSAELPAAGNTFRFEKGALWVDCFL